MEHRLIHRYFIKTAFFQAAYDMDNPPSPDQANTFTKWWKSKPFLVVLMVFFAIGAIIVPLALSVYPPAPTDEVMESPEERESIEKTPEIQQR